MADLDMNQIQALSSNLRAVSDMTYPAIAAIADEYDASSAYNIGEYCIRSGLFYRCNTAIASGGEAWNVTHWDEVSVGEQLNNKVLYFTNVAVTATTGNIVSLSDARITSNHVLSESVFTNPSYITTDISWTTSAGSLILNGTCSTATTTNIVLVKKDN